jgi:hypothetical protein
MKGEDIMDLKAITKKQENKCKKWNEENEVGQKVEYRSFFGDEAEMYKTSSLAWMLSGHTAVVMLAGKSGCVSLDSLTVV